jgi:hypothetical protein
MYPMIEYIIELFVIVFDFLFFLIPIAIPLFLGFLLFHTYIDYNRKKYYNSLQWSLIEVIPSPDNVKSPAAMELFLLSLYQTGGESTWIDRWVNGKVRTWFSLEIGKSNSLLDVNQNYEHILRHKSMHNIQVLKS